MTDTERDYTKDPMSPLEAFYALFQMDRFPDETDDEYEGRLLSQKTFASEIELQGMSTGDFLRILEAQAMPKLVKPNLGSGPLQKLFKKAGI